jgi:hypothetical protein
MKKALVTVLMLASSSVAMAKPVTYSASASVSFGSNPSRPVVIDHRHAADDCHDATPAYVPPLRQPVRPIRPAPIAPIVWNPNNTTLGADSSTYIGAKPVLQSRFEGRWGRNAWLAMTEPTRIDRGREFFTFGAEAGRFRRIQLVETQGRSFIDQVAIEFVGGGRTQVVKLNAQLLPGNPLTIDLDGDLRAINRIVVYGSTGQSSAYQILGM